jgi:hypothetical protein
MEPAAYAVVGHRDDAGQNSTPTHPLLSSVTKTVPRRRLTALLEEEASAAAPSTESMHRKTPEQHFK